LQTFTLTNSGTVKADSGQLFIIDEQVVNTGTLGAFDGGTLKLTSLTVTKADGTVQIGDGASLVLDSATIHGGTVNNGTAAGNDGQYGGIEIKSSSTIDEGATLNYGIVTIERMQGDIARIHSIVEKPRPADAPSNLAVIGRYVLSAQVFEVLADTPPGRGETPPRPACHPSGSQSYARPSPTHTAPRAPPRRNAPPPPTAG